jgi:phosphatidylserine/phosphatidylglycerophosphate/cardiolipin synthase-like enzyme
MTKKKILPIIILIIIGIINIEYKVFGNRYPDWSRSRPARQTRQQRSGQPVNRTRQSTTANESERTLRDLIEVEEFDILLDREYLLALRRDIRQAKESMFIVMYYINADGGSGHIINRLLEDVIKLSETEEEENEIKIEIYLDNSLKAEGEIANNHTYEKLKRTKINVYMNKARLVNHYKLVIIDDEIIYCGSHNWTLSAMLVSTEASVRMKDKTIAAEIKKHFYDNYLKWYD